eukprot:800356-Pyramimonas_sp.AAC.1
MLVAVAEGAARGWTHTRAHAALKAHPSRTSSFQALVASTVATDPRRIIRARTSSHDTARQACVRAAVMCCRLRRGRWSGHSGD